MVFWENFSFPWNHKTLGNYQMSNHKRIWFEDGDTNGQKTIFYAHTLCKKLLRKYDGKVD